MAQAYRPLQRNSSPLQSARTRRSLATGPPPSPAAATVGSCRQSLGMAAAGRALRMAMSTCSGGALLGASRAASQWHQARARNTPHAIGAPSPQQLPATAAAAAAAAAGANATAATAVGARLEVRRSKLCRTVGRRVAGCRTGSHAVQQAMPRSDALPVLGAHPRAPTRIFRLLLMSCWVYYSHSARCANPLTAAYTPPTQRPCASCCNRPTGPTAYRTFPWPLSLPMHATCTPSHARPQDLPWDHTFVTELPADPEPRNFVRQVGPAWG